jgi:putative transposase
MRYIELNPVRAEMVAHPRDYRWSSYAANADGAPGPLLTEHALYRALGATPDARRRDYRALFRDVLDPAFVDALRRATNGGWPLGGERFKRRLAKALGRRVSPRAPGRPPKQGADARQMKLL